MSEPSAYHQPPNTTGKNLHQRPIWQSYEDQQNALVNHHLEAMMRIRTSPGDNSSKENRVRRTLVTARQLKMPRHQARSEGPSHDAWGIRRSPATQTSRGDTAQNNPSPSSNRMR
jgi:hypothetical protein